MVMIRKSQWNAWHLARDSIRLLFSLRLDEFILTHLHIRIRHFLTIELQNDFLWNKFSYRSMEIGEYRWIMEQRKIILPHVLHIESCRWKTHRNCNYIQILMRNVFVAPYRATEYLLQRIFNSLTWNNTDAYECEIND